MNDNSLPSRLVVRSRDLATTAFRLSRNAAIDMKFGPPLAATYIRNRKQSNSDYRELATIFDGRVKNGDVLVDVGCGAGRVINHWLRLGIDSPIYGLEADERLAKFTRRRLRRRENVTIIIGDAIANLPTNGSVFFLFNPFDRSTTDRFADAVLAVASGQGTDVTVIYHYSKHLEAFRGNPRFTVDEVPGANDDPASRQPLAIVTVHPN